MVGGIGRVNVPWMSNPASIRRASYKPLQLWEAEKQCEFNVPHYLITNDTQAAKGFVKDVCAGDAVFKPLGVPMFEDGRELSSVFTNHVRGLADTDWYQLQFAPCIFQERIPRRAEWRVTVVGEDVFPVRIEVALEAVDYRRSDPYSLVHKSSPLPRKLHQACVALTKRFDLRFSAIDLLERLDGEIFFLEINPNGQWKWIEEMTDVPISATIAENLARAARTGSW